MDFERTEEQELLVESLREIYNRDGMDSYIKECDLKHEYPERAVQTMIDNGFHLIGIPEKFGGTPTDILTQIIVIEEASRLGFPPLCWPNAALQVEDILAFGNEDQQKRIIDICLTGKKGFTLGFTEPQAGSDSSAVTSTVTWKNGKPYLNGHKTFNTGAFLAKYMLCIVRDFKNEEPAKDMSLWLVPMDVPGVVIKPIDKIGHFTNKTCEVYFDNVELDPADQVGKEGRGFFNLMKNFEVERLIGTASSLGLAQAAYDEAVRYAGMRKQFGKPIGSFQLIQKKIVDMAIRIENMRNMIYHCAADKMNGKSIKVSAAMTKLYTAQACFEVADDAMQIMGGIGYTNDCKISRIWRDARVYRIMAGTDEIMYHIAGRALIKEAEGK